MKKYKINFNQKSIIATSKNENDVAALIYKKVELIEKIKNDFDIKNENIFLIKDKKQIENILIEKSPEKLITNIKGLEKKFKNINVLYIENQNRDFKENLILSNDVNFKIENLSKINIQNTDYIVENNLNIFDHIKKYGKHYSKIITIENNNSNVAIKTNGIWRVRNEIETELLYSAKRKKYVFNNSATKFQLTNEFNEEETSIEIFGNKIFFNESYLKDGNLVKKINWILGYDFNIFLTKAKNSFFKIEKHKFQIDKFEYDKFIKKIINNETIVGVPYKKFEQVGNADVISFEKGNVVITKNENELIFTLDFISDSNEEDLIAYTIGIRNNIENNIKNITDVKKIKIGNILQSIFGILMLIILAYLTFALLYDPNTIKNAFGLIFSLRSWTLPWIYLILILFAFSFFLPLLTSIFIEKLILKREKLEFKRLLIYFFATILRRMVMFVTGMYFLSIFIWGWYLNRKLQIKTSSIVSGWSSTSLLRGIIFAIIGTTLMIIGTLTLFTKYNAPSTTEIIITVCISWLGFTWEIISHFWIFFIILSPSFQLFIGNLNTKFKFRNKTITNEHLEKNIKII